MDEVVGVNFGENWISIDPEADYDKTLAAVQEVVDGYPGSAPRRADLPRRSGSARCLSPGRARRSSCGSSATTSRRCARTRTRSRTCWAGIDGVVDENVELQADVPQVEVEVDLAKAERYGLKPGDVRRAAATFMAGEEVGDIFRDGKAYDVQVWSTPETRNSLTAIRRLPLDTPDGGRREPRATWPT